MDALSVILLLIAALALVFVGVAVIGVVQWFRDSMHWHIAREEADRRREYFKRLQRDLGTKELP